MNCSINKNDLICGAYKAFEGHQSKKEVKKFIEDFDSNIDLLYREISDGSYVKLISYRKLFRINNDGKKRDIDSPDLITRIFQHTFMRKVQPFYDHVDNWIKCLIGIEEKDENEIATGKILAREFHGNYQGIIQFIRAVEKEYRKEDILPIEDAEIINQCGYIFRDSTNQLKYIV